MTPPTSETPILVTTITSAPSAYKQTTTHWTAESIRECFGEDDPSSLVLALLNKLEQSETRLRAAEAEIAAICNHHCESQGCALPDGYTETAKRYADSFHAMKSERDQARATIATLTGQLAEAQRDARRYRFLRRLDAKGIQVYDGSNDRSIFGDELDAAIDAAIAKDDTHGNG